MLTYKINETQQTIENVFCKWNKWETTNQFSANVKHVSFNHNRIWNSRRLFWMSVSDHLQRRNSKIFFYLDFNLITTIFSPSFLRPSCRGYQSLHWNVKVQLCCCICFPCRNSRVVLPVHYNHISWDLLQTRLCSILSIHLQTRR